MNVWDFVGWVVVAILLLIALAILAVVVFIAISYSLYLRDKRRERLKEEEEERLKKLPAPYFKSMDAGDMFSVDYQAWKISDLETEYDPVTAAHRLRITAKSVGVGL